MNNLKTIILIFMTLATFGYTTTLLAADQSTIGKQTTEIVTEIHGAETVGLYRVTFDISDNLVNDCSAWVAYSVVTNDTTLYVTNQIDGHSYSWIIDNVGGPLNRSGLAINKRF